MSAVVDGLDAVLRRCKKMLAIAEDSRANPGEAAAAAAMAEKIMRKYQIDNADVIAADLGSGNADMFGTEDVGSTLDVEGRSKESKSWAGSLAVRVAGFTDCQARYVWSGKHGKAIRFSGYAADAQMARFTYIYLVNTMAAASRAYAKENGSDRTSLESFRQGFCKSLRDLLDQATAAKKAEMQASVSSRSLVVVKGQAVADYFGDVKYRDKSSRRRVTDAYSDGAYEGNKVDVTRRGVGSSAGSQRLSA